MANSNLIKSTLGTNVVVITDSKNREINMLRVKSLNGDDILNLQAKIEANRDTIKKEKLEEEKKKDSELLLLESQRKIEELKEKEKRIYSKVNFLTVVNYLLIANMFGWYNVDKKKLKLIIDDTLNNITSVKEAIEKEENLNNVFKLLIKGE